MTSRTKRQEFGLFSHPTAGSAKVTMGSGTYSKISSTKGKFS